MSDMGGLPPKPGSDLAPPAQHQSRFPRPLYKASIASTD